MVDQTIWSGFLEFHFKKKSFGDSNVCAGLGQDSFPRVQPYYFYHVIMKTWEKEGEDLASLPLVKCVALNR